MRKSSWKSQLTSSLFVLPYLFLFIVFLLIPIGYGAWISLHNWDLLNPVYQFVGFKNYTKIFDSDSYLNDLFFEGLKNTFQFVVYSVPLLVVVGLGLALLVNALPSKIKGFFRTVYFIPYAVSVSIVAIIWLWILDTNSGLINQYLQKWNIPMIPWLTEMPWAWVSLVMATLWWTIGFNMVIFINALNDVPEELYEAGSLDGASRWQRLIYITLPSIKPTMLFVFITSTIASFNIYGQPFLMTRGGPGTETKVLLMNIVDEAFEQRQLGNAAAMSILMALIMIIISVLQFRISNRKE
ncbi:sugar ABC transporter permease [Neobacillus sedimentimangrovi]|jgi:multiple sugar transport system permease protein|uniref:Sugar ABC transporter permease n=1 Tax=Neobacillus sedimentimangrovi TaxID=2699460 RepID=A0ABS8QF98_9BACI|nr:sugar ABC transporter permease [Neobacillus sedimentimangrovi]MCD4837460.1 sugar ABC transporter permease [Neobacillus sedimentimangrovi]